ncbi:MAG: NTP transferase domain-containing protein [Spirochaetaceae bacterium]|jgi:spore coat polysaccharide biosynthesis protein SpsF|nr:NTP transferase domain-containing protein [Spirochaetaceae bacterium]
MTALIVQARLDSSRLPRKAILDLGGEPLVVRVMQALNAVQCDIKILACPHDAAEAFTPLAFAAGFNLFAGSKEDVLGRYAAAVRHFALDAGNCRIIRATGDNPFVFADAAEKINDEAAGLDADYAAYSGLPYGAGVESVSAAALLRADAESSTPYEREHVCPYLYMHPEIFTLHRPLAPSRWKAPHIRLTVDTADDYQYAQTLFAKLPVPPARYTGTAVIAAASSNFKI